MPKNAGGCKIYEIEAYIEHFMTWIPYKLMDKFELTTLSCNESM